MWPYVCCSNPLWDEILFAIVIAFYFDKNDHNLIFGNKPFRHVLQLERVFLKIFRSKIRQPSSD